MFLRNEIAARLEDQGFLNSFGPCLAEKIYDTAVGAKLATIWLSPPNPASARMTLSGYYYSEGRNILESCVQLIDANAGLAQCMEVVDKFALQVEKAVAGSYAVRLHQLGIGSH